MQKNRLTMHRALYVSMCMHTYAYVCLCMHVYARVSVTILPKYVLCMCDHAFVCVLFNMKQWQDMSIAQRYFNVTKVHKSVNDICQLSSIVQWNHAAAHQSPEKAVWDSKGKKAATPIE
jgi:hypothetical protein